MPHPSESAFLENLAKSLGLTKRVEQAYFSMRYDPKNDECKNADIAKAVNSHCKEECDAGNVDKSVWKALEKQVTKSFPNLAIPETPKCAGAPTTGQERWRQWSKLLWDEVYPRWLWEQAFQKAKPCTLEVVTPVTRDAKYKKTPIARVDQGVDLTLEFPSNPQPPAEVIILNQGVSKTIYCFCPSAYYAPCTKVMDGRAYLPQQEGEQYLSFDTPGTEKFLVIGCTNASEILNKWNLQEGEIEASQLKQIGLDLWEGKTSIFKAELQVTG